MTLSRRPPAPAPLRLAPLRMAPLSMAPLALGLAACLATAGCGEKKDSAGAESAKGGDLLPRSISDDMLPYDTVRSQSGPDATAAPVEEARTRAASPADSASDAPDAAAEPAQPASAGAGAGTGSGAPVTSSGE